MEQASPPPQEPATRADVRSLRIWIAVAAFWAVAATAVALVALLDDNDNSSSGGRADVAKQLGSFESSMNRRLESLRSQIDELPRADDVTRLDQRLRKVEDETKSASADAGRTGDSVSKLETSVKDLQDSVKSSAGTQGK
jgi:TolA-binding protein